MGGRASVSVSEVGAGAWRVGKRDGRAVLQDPVPPREQVGSRLEYDTHKRGVPGIFQGYFKLPGPPQERPGPGLFWHEGARLGTGVGCGGGDAIQQGCLDSSKCSITFQTLQSQHRKVRLPETRTTVVFSQYQNARFQSTIPKWMYIRGLSE